MELTRFNELVSAAKRAAEASGFKGQNYRDFLRGKFALDAGVDLKAYQSFKARHLRPQWRTQSDMREHLTGLLRYAGLLTAPRVALYTISRKAPTPAQLDGPRDWTEVADPAGACVGVTNGAALGFNLPWKATKSKVPPGDRPKPIELARAKQVACEWEVGRTLEVLGVTIPTVTAPVPMVLLAIYEDDRVVAVQEPYFRWFQANYPKSRLVFRWTIKDALKIEPASFVIQVYSTLGGLLGCVMPYRADRYNLLPATRSDIVWAA